ncbi:MAG: hypothetical protein NWE79_07910 [Candidatus Bathyarchaeota archaeon]|jgi:hypothetical protein|nr:hypothetical protein [Candidatus Bathyarchaeota archaeon]
MADVIGIWIQALLTIAITSLAWRDQPVSKFAEHIYLGVVTANSIVMAWRDIYTKGITRITGGEVVFILAIALGVMTYARYSRKYFWLYRYPIALVVGIGVGTAMRGLVGGSFLDQLRDSFIRLSVPGDIWGSINNIVFFAILLTTLSYFLFTVKATRSGAAMQLSAIGRYAMMAAFGYSFANTIATRINQYAGRIAFLMLDWLQLGA